MRWWSWMWFKQGQIEVDGGVGCDCDSGECGDGHAEGTRLAGIPFNTKLPSLNPPPNQSNLVFNLSLILVHYNLQLYLHNHQL